MMTFDPDRFLSYNPDSPEIPAEAYLFPFPDGKELLTDHLGRVVVIRRWALVRELFSRTFPGGKSLVAGGLSVAPFGVIAVGPAEWEAYEADQEGLDNYAEYDSVDELLQSMQESAIQKLEEMRKHLEKGG